MIARLLMENSKVRNDLLDRIEIIEVDDNKLNKVAGYTNKPNIIRIGNHQIDRSRSVRIFVLVEVHIASKEDRVVRQEK